MEILLNHFVIQWLIQHHFEMLLKNAIRNVLIGFYQVFYFMKCCFEIHLFLSDNKDDLFKNILEKDENKIYFPDYITNDCQNFIKNLLTKNPEKRLRNLKDAIEN